MTYAVLTSDPGNVAYLNPPEPSSFQALIAPCLDRCDVSLASQPQGTSPEASEREFSGDSPLPSQGRAERSETPENTPLLTDLEVRLKPEAASPPGIAPPELSPSESNRIPETASPAIAPGVSSPPGEAISQELRREELPANFSVFPVGILVGPRTVESAVRVKGAEDGSEALDFDRWLVPYETVVDALRLTVTPLPDGQLEMRSPGLVVRLDPDQIQNDPDLGLVFSIQEIEDLFGVPASFDMSEYAIRFEPPWLALQGTGIAGPAQPIDLEGLPVISPPDASVTQLEQRFDLSDRGDSDVDYRGSFAAVGALPGASWFVRVDQPGMIQPGDWRLLEAQILRQRDALDVTLGSQGAFWQEGGEADLWGVTVVGRNGFTPNNLQLGNTAPRQRLESAQLGRTITGEAEPGTLVRLTEGFGDRVIAEEFVDSSGVFRFEDVPFSNNLTGNNYLLLLYPNGRLTELPEVRVATFTTVGGQIPEGTSAWAIAAGWGRETDDESGFFGDFDEFRGGATYRLGLSESTTLGVGIVYDDGLRALGEIFLQPGGVPLELAARVLTPDDDGDWDWDANLRYDPTDTFRATLTSDPIDTRLTLGWQVIPEVELLSLIRTENPSEFGFQLSLSGDDAFTYARVTLDTDGDLRWNGIQRWGLAELTTRGDDVSTFSELTYNFSGDRFYDAGHTALVSYETRDTDDDAGNLATVGWRYRSPDRASDGNYAWEARLGLGFGSEGSGILASVQTAAVPGFLLRARYDGISPTTNEDAFRLEVVSSLRTQGRIRPGDRRTNFLRTQGGLIVEPFLDTNSNGQFDEGETWYTDNSDLLLILNNEPIRLFRPEVSDRNIFFRVNPGTYRLDLDPAGYPLDWQPDIRALAVEVNAGVFTIVPVPFIPSYTVSGIATDAEGNPVIGGRIEAVSATGERVFSVTNDAGVFYLEGLRLQTYTLEINGEPAQPGVLELNAESGPFQELNLIRPNQM